MFSVELDAELDDDKYMKEENNIIVHTKPNIDSQVLEMCIFCSI